MAAWIVLGDECTIESGSGGEHILSTVSVRIVYLLSCGSQFSHTPTHSTWHTERLLLGKWHDASIAAEWNNILHKTMRRLFYFGGPAMFPKAIRFHLGLTEAN
jgi:hypothetical protein